MMQRIKRPGLLVLILGMCLGVPLGWLGTTRYQPDTAPSTDAIRAVALSFADVNDPARMATLAERMRSLNVNMVGLNAGRADWSYFRWEGREEWWSSTVEEEERDLLAEATSHFEEQEVHISAIIDVFAERYLERNPEAAARNAAGEPSSEQVSLTALVSGEFGNHLLEMIGYLSANYAVDSIALTELFYDDYGYGDDDRKSYMAHTGQPDWPRLSDGSIHTDDPSIGVWRSELLAQFVARAAEAAHAGGSQLFVDVRVSWGNLPSESRENGQDYARLLFHADRLVLWNYFGLSGYPPEYVQEIASHVTKYGADKMIISVGLWAEQEQVISPQQLREAVEYTQASEVPHLWITPSHLLSEEHWRALEATWGA